MPVSTTRIDDLNYAQLRAALVAEIPQILGDNADAPDWSDHNPSDIGIAMLELLAAMAESVVFRADQITPQVEHNFLRLVLDRPEPVTTTARFVRRQPAVSPAAAPPAGLPPELAALLTFDAGSSTLSSTRSLSDSELASLLAAGSAAFQNSVTELYDAWQRQVTIFPGTRLATPAGATEFETVTRATTRPGELSVDTVLRHRSIFDQLPHLSGTVYPLGTASGTADQRLTTLPTRNTKGEVWPVLLDESNLGPLGYDPNPRVLLVPPAGSGLASEEWRYVPDFLEAGPEDPVFTVDLVTFDLRFGDGEHGRLPTPGYTIELQWLQRVEGRDRQRDVSALSAITASVTPWQSLSAAQQTAVNALANTRYDADSEQLVQSAPMIDADLATLLSLLPADVDWAAAVNNLYEVSHLRFGSPLDAPAAVGARPLYGMGGRFLFDRENASREGLRQLLDRDRVVSAEDFEYLAQYGFNREVSHDGPPIARAHALSTDLAGAIAVVIIPAGNPGDQAPEPTMELMERVSLYLDQRRLITTRLFVRPPEYVDVPITVDAVSRNLDDNLALRNRIEAALLDYFHPLHGGDDGRGWPLGRALYRADVFQLLHAIEGLDHVANVILGNGGVRDFFAIDPLQLPRVTRTGLNITVSSP